MDEGAVMRRVTLRNAGWDDGRIARSLRRGSLLRVGADRYVLPGTVPTLAQIVATAGSGVALSHASAARAWGLPADDPRTHVTVPHGARRHGLRAHPVVVHARRHWCPEVLDGLAVTGVGSTVADLLRSQDLHDSVPVADAALRQGLVTAAALAESVGSRVPGNARARRAMALADGRAESPLETRLRLLLTLGGVPPDDLQHDVHEAGSFVARVDLWYDAGIVVEADGFEFHRERADFVADRRKAQAFARLDLRLLRFSWEDVHRRPDVVIATVRSVLDRLSRRAA